MPEHRRAGRRRGCAARLEPLRRDGARDVGKGRCVVASATRRPPPTSIMTGSGAPQRGGEVLGVAGEGDAGIVDDALVHRCRYHRVELAREASVDRAVEQRQDVPRIRADPVVRPCRARRAARAAPRLDPRRGRPGRNRAGRSCACARRGPVRAATGPPAARPRQSKRRPRQRCAQVGSDAGRLPGRQRDGPELARRAHRYST